MNAKQLTAAETIVMKCIWDADHEMSLAEIVKNANEGYGKEWKPQTVMYNPLQQIRCYSHPVLSEILPFSLPVLTGQILFLP